MASNSDVQYVAYLKAKFNLADADLLQVISLSQRSVPAPAPQEQDSENAPEGGGGVEDEEEEIEEESYEEEEEKVEVDAEEGPYEEVVEDDGYEDVEDVEDEYMDESVEELEDEEKAMAPVPAPLPLKASESDALVEAPTPSDAIVAYEEFNAGEEFEETPDDEPPSVRMPETVASDPRVKRPNSVKNSVVELQEEYVAPDEENLLAIKAKPTSVAIVPYKSTAIVPAKTGKPSDVEPPVRPAEEEGKEDNRMLLVAAALCILLLIAIAIILILIFITETIPKFWEPEPTPVAMSPYQPGNCNFEGQAQPNFASQCSCTGSVTQIADFTSQRYSLLSTEFIVPTVYTSWSLPIESCDPANLALLWLSTGAVITDPLTLTQRFILALLYYSTQGQQWTTQSNWLSSNPECSWYGISCNGANLQQIQLLGNALDGLIPAELALLTVLDTLSLDENNIQKSIPSNIFNMTSLRTLTLGTNQLTGTMPTMIGMATGLQKLRLNSNVFTGAVPTELNLLTQLQVLSLADNNMLTGRIASEYGLFTNLLALSLSGTSLRSTIPSEYGNLANLQELGIANTTVGGIIPTQLGQLRSLTLVDFTGSRFRQLIPTFFGSLPNLYTLKLGHNEFKGPIPSELGTLNSLQYLELDNNELSGLLPTELGNLQSLVMMTIEGNPNLSGTAPAEICSLRSGQLVNFTSDCPTRQYGVLCPLFTCCSACVRIDSLQTDPPAPILLP